MCWASQMANWDQLMIAIGWWEIGQVDIGLESLQRSHLNIIHTTDLCRVKHLIFYMKCIYKKYRC